MCAISNVESRLVFDQFEMIANSGEHVFLSNNYSKWYHTTTTEQNFSLFHCECHQRNTKCVCTFWQSTLTIQTSVTTWRSIKNATWSFKNCVRVYSSIPKLVETNSHDRFNLAFEKQIRTWLIFFDQIQIYFQISFFVENFVTCVN